MKTFDQIQQAMIKTYDPRELTGLVQDALDLAKFYSAKAELIHARENKLRAQVDRQTQMITNLENTLRKQ